jgi:hypothetical protein
MTWHFHSLEAYVPRRMIQIIYPIDKTDLDMLRLTHFLVLALLVVRFVPADWSASVVRCFGRLPFAETFPTLLCLGVMLSFSAHWVLTQYDGSVAAQFGVSAIGIAIMTVVARELQLAEDIPDLFVDDDVDTRSEDAKFAPEEASSAVNS